MSSHDYTNGKVQKKTADSKSKGRKVATFYHVQCTPSCQVSDTMEVLLYEYDI